MHKSTHLISVTLWFLSIPSYMISSKCICQTNRALCLTTNNTPYGITDKLFWIYQRCEHFQMALSTHVTVTMLIYSSKTTNSYPLNLLIFTPSRSQKMLRNIPTVQSRDQNAFSSPSISDHIPKIWKYFFYPLPPLSVIKLHLSNLWSLAYHLAGYLFLINLS